MRSSNLPCSGGSRQLVTLGRIGTALASGGRHPQETERVACGAVRGETELASSGAVRVKRLPALSDMRAGDNRPGRGPGRAGV
eukprot:358340-Chlamydomonas_euryale.AAC.2